MRDSLIAILGTGNMGEALLRGLVKGGYPAICLRAYDVDAAKTAALAQACGITACSSLEEAALGADWLVLATKPQVFVPELLPRLARCLVPGQGVISIAAGVRLSTLEEHLGAGRPLIRVMPNTPGLIGKGVSAYCLGGSATPAAGELAQRLLQPLGLALNVKEEEMDAVTALSGSGPAYVFLFMEALQAAGEALGLEKEAAFTLASQTLSGAAAMIQAKQKTPPELRAQVTSPGGTTAAAIKAFEEGDLRGLVLKALVAARDRSVELGQK